jgi:hypothetical protein
VSLSHWVNRPDIGLNSRFAATLFLYQRLHDPEIRDRITAFWSGDPLSVGQLRKWLRELGEDVAYRVESVPSAEMAIQRFAFLPRLAMAAGYTGWVLLVDELELIGRYSVKQRARSYAELARWAGKSKGGGIPGLTAVFAITTDFDAAVLHERNDFELVPGKLRASEHGADRLLAAKAEQGMRFIAREVVRLKGPDRASVERIHEEVRVLYARVYGWDPPGTAVGQRLATTRLRQYVRRWVNEWDLQRLYPGYVAGNTVIDSLAPDYSERPELEAADELPDGMPG